MIVGHYSLNTTAGHFSKCFSVNSFSELKTLFDAWYNSYQLINVTYNGHKSGVFVIHNSRFKITINDDVLRVFDRQEYNSLINLGIWE